jgi:AcrR family transcriptional regulator
MHRFLPGIGQEFDRMAVWFMLGRTLLSNTEPRSTILNMSVHLVAPVAERRARALLDRAVEVLVADPGASLAEVAEAAGISRTTLHKHFATREDLVRAVGLRAIGRWEQAVDEVVGDGPDGGLRDLMAAAIECGPQLQFIWRSPVLDGDDELLRRRSAVEQRSEAVLLRARELGVIAAGVPDWWLLESLYALSYTAFEMVRSGRLAPLDAPGLALNTLLHGIGAES